MGWTSTRRPYGLNTREWLAQDLLGSGYEVVEFGAHGFNLYAAVRKTGDTDVVGLVVLCHHSRAGEITYKCLEEFSGPCEDGCPAHVLDALTPLDAYPPDDYRHNHEWAASWRQRCRDRLDRRALARTVTPGDIVQFGRVMKFSNGDEADTFEFIRRNHFQLPGGPGVRYRITNWRESEFTVVQRKAA